MPSGYSGTPLAKKLGIKNGLRVWLINQPSYYFDLMLDLGSIELVKTNPREIDFVHLFCTHQKQLKSQFNKGKAALKKSGMLWVSWPKKSAGITSDLSRDWIRDYVLTQGLIDIKVCAVDETWSGLKFVYRKEDR